MHNQKYFTFTLLIGILLAGVQACQKFTPNKESSATVYVQKTERGYQLIRNNTPFIIKGAAGDGHLAELREAGGNTIRLYDTIDLRTHLDAAHDAGLAAIVDIPLPKYGDGSHFYSRDISLERKQIADLVKNHKDHPALLYWNVGNELYYPTAYSQTKFFDSFNSLVRLVKEVDPNHPVSTAIIGGNRRRLASVALKSPDLDLISMNSFGNLTHLKDRLEPIRLIWNGPFVISEWGVNGPWEEAETSWGAPIEHNSSKKAAILEARYHSEIMDDPNLLGSVVFFWGSKQERTPTWFSIFSPEGHKSEAFYTLQSLWKQKPTEAYLGPRANVIRINGKTSRENVILSAGKIFQAELESTHPSRDTVMYHWEIRKEAWAEVEEEQAPEIDLIKESDQDKISFKTPEEEGPYRLYVYLTDGKQHFSTTNIPFYVLNPKDGQ